MPNLRRLNQQLLLVRTPDPLLLWERVLVLAVTSNPFSVDDQIRVLLLLELKRYDLLLSWADVMSQTVYETPMVHYRIHQLAALIRKFPVPEALTGLNARQAALKTFLAAEHRCKRENQRLRAIRSTGRDEYGGFIHHARAWILYVLGHEPSLPHIYQSSDFTPGASLGCHGNATNVARKLTSDWSVTPSALPYALGAIWSNSQIREYVLRNEHSLPCLDKTLFRDKLLCKVVMVRYNKISFVPKTAKTDRSIAVEPFLNTYLQRGVDQVIRDRLKRVGLDLSRQAPNQEFARQGSLPGAENAYCTIDLSSASDTMATEWVRELLPERWFELLNDLRSPSYQIDGASQRYHKFVSMGNGFCFPLQTLIFASLCHAAYVMKSTTPEFRVYGDDIIVRQEVFGDVIKLLRHTGFSPNPRKTFSQGPFRESCGTDWHTGVNVRPVFLDHPLDSLERVFGFHNQSLRREFYVRDFFAEIRDMLYKLVPKSLRFVSHVDPNPDTEFVPGKETIDGALWVPFDVFMGSRFSSWYRPEQRWRWVTIIQTARADREFRPSTGIDPLVLLIGALRGANSDRPFTLRYSTQTKAVLV